MRKSAACSAACRKASKWSSISCISYLNIYITSEYIYFYRVLHIQSIYSSFESSLRSQIGGRDAIIFYLYVLLSIIAGFILR